MTNSQLSVDINDFSDMAKAWEMADDPPQNVSTLRLFSIWEITRYLIPVAPAHLRRVLRNQPDLPQGRTGSEHNARWFSFEDVRILRMYFSQEGAQHKDYLPYRPTSLPAQIICTAHATGGIGRTTLAVHLAVAAALDGYRVLAIDLDPQGDLTDILGGNAGQAAAAMLIARHHSEHLQLENRLRASRGEMPVPLDAVMSDALSIDKSDLVAASRWAGLDLLAAGPELAATDMRCAQWRLGARSWRPWDWLGAEQQEGGLFETYDLILIDTPADLGVLSISGIAASDLLMVPAGTDGKSFAATSAFFKLLHQSLSEIETRENATAQALGNAPIRFGWAAVRTVLTQYDTGGQEDITALAQSGPDRMLLPARQELTSLIGTGGGRARCLYDVDYRDFNRETYVTARRGFDETYRAVKRIFTGNWRLAQ